VPTSPLNSSRLIAGSPKKYFCKSLQGRLGQGKGTLAPTNAAVGRQSLPHNYSRRPNVGERLSSFVEAENAGVSKCFCLASDQGVLKISLLKLQ
jgi:hypothetical protein